MNENVEKIIKMLESKPEYEPILRELLELHTQNPMRGRSWMEGDRPAEAGWEWGVHYSLNPGRLAYLVGMNILAKWGSRSTKIYGLRDPEDVREALEHIEDHERFIEERAEAPLEIPDDLFSPIVGHEEKKKLFLMGLKSEHPVHFILKGKHATAKSIFLMELEMIPGAVGVEGTTSSKCGVNDILLDEKPKILIIDEISNFKADERTVILELTGKGTASDTKHNRKIKITLPTKVFAACNRVNGFTDEFLSRFEIVEFHEYSEQEFMDVAVNMLVMREGVEKDIAEYIAERTWKLPKRFRDVRQCIRIARMAPDREAVDWYLEYKLGNIKGR